ncbi:uncharacterized protein LOC134664599 [Cydia fagiglandana]|uniref:uncharacterized protein LOC134664599 n=1 Tax=Cydia fagiglandana TaxID=1458189 RepID=UPI002FEE3AC5
MEKPGLSPHKSYFWSCLTLQEDCPFLSSNCPTLFNFGIGLFLLYVIYLLIIVFDYKFHSHVDEMQHQIDFYMSLISKKVKLVQRNEGRLMNMQERTDKLLMKGRQGVRMLEALRDAVARDDLVQLQQLVQLAEKNANEERLRNNFPTIPKEKLLNNL